MKKCVLPLLKAARFSRLVRLGAFVFVPESLRGEVGSMCRDELLSCSLDRFQHCRILFGQDILIVTGYEFMLTVSRNGRLVRWEYVALEFLIEFRSYS